MSGEVKFDESVPERDLNQVFKPKETNRSRQNFERLLEEKNSEAFRRKFKAMTSRKPIENVMGDTYLRSNWMVLLGINPEYRTEFHEDDIVRTFDIITAADTDRFLSLATGLIFFPFYRMIILRRSPLLSLTQPRFASLKFTLVGTWLVTMKSDLTFRLFSYPDLSHICSKYDLVSPKYKDYFSKVATTE